MKEVPYCLPEVFETVIAAACKVSSDHFIHEKVLEKVLSAVSSRIGGCSSSEALLYEALEIAYHALGVKDPYAEVKSGLNHCAVAVRRKIQAGDGEFVSSLPATLCYSLAASDRSVFEGSVAQLYDFFHSSVSSELEFEAARELQQKIASAGSIMFLAANAGELVIDALLLEKLAESAKVTVAVASKPVLLRATEADAEFAGIGGDIALTDPGSGMLGISLEKASSEFREAFAEADLVLSKGEVNFKTLAGCGREVYYLMYSDVRGGAKSGGNRRVLFSTDGK